MDYFAANDLAPFSVLSGVPTETTGNVDLTYTPTGIFPNGGQVQSPPFINPDTGATTALTSLWFHMELFTANNGGLNSLVEFVNSSGVSVVRFVSTTNVTFRIDYWNSATSAWVAGPTTFNPGSVRIAVDINIICGSGGSATVYFANSQQLSLTGFPATVDNVQSLKFGGPANYTYSQLLVSDANTIGAKVSSLVPNANSATNTAWANDWNNIKKTGFNDATMISSSTTGDNESYGATDATLPTAQYTVSSVWFAVRARLNSGAGGAHFKPLLRIGSTNYAGTYNFAGNLNAVSFNGAIAGFSKDPSTAANWNGVTNINAAEWGFQTAA